MRTAALLQSTRLGRKTVEQQVAEFGAMANARLEPAFRQASVAYPPERLTLVALKSERVLELYASPASGPCRLIKTYPILAASGTIGPKLREGDGQVPEGIYRIESLNPNSLYHLSLRLDYPNDFDRARARQEGRRDLGGDIMIHGGAASVGCLAMGDEASEDLFVLVARVGLPNVVVIIAPVDLRVRNLPAHVEPLPRWMDQLYANIKTALRAYPVSPVEARYQSGST